MTTADESWDAAMDAVADRVLTEAEQREPIALDPETRVPYIRGTRIQVATVVADAREKGAPPEYEGVAPEAVLAALRYAEVSW